MRGVEPGPTRAIDATIGRVLRVGVAVSLALVVAGMALAFARPGSPERGGAAELAHLVDPAVANPRSVADVASGAVHLQPTGLVMLGLLVLIATPVLRVVASVVGFARAGDRTYTAITAVVLALVALAFTLGAT